MSTSTLTEETEQYLQTGVNAFVTPPREFVIHNASREEIRAGWDGEELYFPPNQKIVMPDVRLRRWSAKDADGDYIPGTLLVSDISEVNLQGSETLIWSAAQAVRHILGISSRSDVAGSGYARRGLSLLPLNPAKDVIARVAAGGKVRAEDWMVECANQTLAAYEQRDLMRKRLNLPEIAKSSEYAESLAIVGAANERLALEAREKVGYVPESVKPQLDITGLVEQLADNQDFLRLIQARIALKEVRPVRGKEEAPDKP
jgi:hypothetical protein